MIDRNLSFEKTTTISLLISDLNLMPGEYYVTIAITDTHGPIEILEHCYNFSIVENDVFKTGRIPKGTNIIYSNAKWELK